MAKQDDDARQRDKAEVVVDVALSSDDDAAEVAKPGEDALDLPATTIAAEGAAALLRLVALRRMAFAHWKPMA